MELLWKSIQMDWPVLLPILVCSILVVGVVINRFSFYKKNKRDVVLFIPRLQKNLLRIILTVLKILQYNAAELSEKLRKKP